MTLRTYRSLALSVAMMGAAAPAFAQAGLCGGTGDGGQWIGGDAAQSDVATTDGYLEQMALVLGGNEYVALFSLSTAAEVRVEAAGRGAGDPIIDLLSDDGSVLVSDDDSGGDSASRAEIALDPGTYCMALRSYDGGPMTAFVRIGLTKYDALTEGTVAATDPTQGDPAEGDASCEGAESIDGLGTTVTGSAGASPFWTFTLDTPTAVTIRAENEAADPVIILFDENDNQIAENDDYDGYNAQIDMSDPLDPGTYCIGVEAIDDSDAPISVSVTEYDPVAALLALYDQGEAAPPLGGDHPIADLGVLATQLRVDIPGSTDTVWHVVEVTEDSLMLIEAIAAGENDPWLVVYDDLGREVGRNDDYGDGLDSLLAQRVGPGKYLIGVRQYESGQGFIRLLIERYTRAQ